MKKHTTMNREKYLQFIKEKLYCKIEENLTVGRMEEGLSIFAKDQIDHFILQNKKEINNYINDAMNKYDKTYNIQWFDKIYHYLQNLTFVINENVLVGL
jgi:hypothetical protein